MTAALPAGWFVPVTPGTRHVTVGGAIAADVHGKNHHAAGQLRHPRALVRPAAGGRQTRRVTPDGDPELFWATAGGMGLTGIILRAAIGLTKVETSRLKVDTVRTADIDETMAHLSATDDRYDYTVAWTDCLARGARLGRSVITSGDFAALDELAPWRPAAHPLAFQPSGRLSAPPVFPSGLLNPVTVGLANEAYFRKAPRRLLGRDPDHRHVLPPAGRDPELEPGLRPVRVPPVPVRGAVRPGAAGAPLARADQRGPCPVLRHRAQAVRPRRRRASCRSRCPAGRWPWTSRPARPAWPTCCDRLDEQVLDAGGRVYLAKDSRVHPEVLAQMYPRLEEFRKLRAGLDPSGVLGSDLSRRLGL